MFSLPPLSCGGKIIMVYFLLFPIGLPVQYEGITWIYEGDVLKPMPEAVRYKIYEENGDDFSSRICSGTKIEDLDEKAIEDFRRRWIEKSGNT